MKKCLVSACAALLALVAPAMSQSPDEREMPDERETLMLLEPTAHNAVTARKKLLHNFDKMSARAKLQYHEHLALTAYRVVPEHVVRHSLTWPADITSIHSELEQFLVTASDSDVVALYNDFLVYKLVTTSQPHPKHPPPSQGRR